MRCDEAIGMVDLGMKNQSYFTRARIRVHLALCAACRRYVRFGAILKSAIQSLFQIATAEITLNSLNSELLKKFSIKT